MGPPRRGRGVQTPKWSQVQSMLGAKSFVPSMIQYDARSLDQTLRRHVDAHFPFSPTCAAEVHRASSACDPIYQWLEQVMTDETYLEIDSAPPIMMSPTPMAQVTEAAAEPAPEPHVSKAELEAEQARLVSEQSDLEEHRDESLAPNLTLTLTLTTKMNL